MAIALDKDVVFNPISFEDFVAPFQMYKQAYDQAEANFDKLSEAAKLEYMMASDNDRNSEAFKRYKGYMDGLNETMDEFAGGLNLKIQKSLGQYKKRYSTDILPVEEALKRRTELTEEQRKLAQQDKSLVFERDAKDLNLDDIIANPAIGYGKSFSGKDVIAYSGQMAQTLQKVYTDMYVGGQITADEYQRVMKLVTTQGIDLDSLNAFLADPNNKNTKYYKDLAPIMENIYNMTGIRDWQGYSDEDRYNMLKPYLTIGMQNAIGETKITPHTVKISTGGGGKDGVDGRGKPIAQSYDAVVDIATLNEAGDWSKKYNSLLKDGKLDDKVKTYLAAKNKKQYIKDQKEDIVKKHGRNTSAQVMMYNLNSLTKLADDLIQDIHNNYPEIINKGTNRIAFQDIEKAIQGSRDIQNSAIVNRTKARVNIGSKDHISTNLDTNSNGKAYIYELASGKNNQGVSLTKTNKTMDVSDLEDDNKSIKQLLTTTDGLAVQLTDGKVLKFDKTVNSNVQNNLINAYNNWIQTWYKEENDPENSALYEQERRILSDEMQGYISTLIGETSAGTTTINPLYYDSSN